MKIRRGFSSRAISDKKDTALWIVSAVPICYTRTNDFANLVADALIRDQRLTLGSIINLRYARANGLWLEATTALETERSTNKIYSKTNQPITRTAAYPAHYQKTGLDDIVVSGGYNFLINPRTQLVLYGIAGFPTKRSISLVDSLGAFVGTRFFSIGAGSEASYGFIHSFKRALTGIVQTRLIHFFSRRWDPILPAGSTINPGNTLDVLCALRMREKEDLFEIGYNPTVFLNQSIQTPIQKTSTDTFVRQGGYISYTHIFSSLKHPMLVGAGSTFNRSHFLNTKIYSAWINITVVF